MGNHIFGQKTMKPDALKALIQVTLELAHIREKILEEHPIANKRLKRCESLLIKIANLQGVSVEDYQDMIKNVLEDQKAEQAEEAEKAPKDVGV